MRLVLVFEGCLVRCVPLLEGVCCQPDVLLVLLLCGDEELVYIHYTVTFMSVICSLIKSTKKRIM